MSFWHLSFSCERDREAQDLVAVKGDAVDALLLEQKLNTKLHRIGKKPHVLEFFLFQSVK